MTSPALSHSTYHKTNIISLFRFLSLTSFISVTYPAFIHQKHDYQALDMCESLFQSLGAQTRWSPACQGLTLELRRQTHKQLQRQCGGTHRPTTGTTTTVFPWEVTYWILLKLMLKFLSGSEFLYIGVSKTSFFPIIYHVVKDPSFCLSVLFIQIHYALPLL